MLFYIEPVIVNQCVMLSNWLGIMVSYAEPVVVNPMCYAETGVVNHGELY